MWECARPKAATDQWRPQVVIRSVTNSWVIMSKKGLVKALSQIFIPHFHPKYHPTFNTSTIVKSANHKKARFYHGVHLAQLGAAHLLKSFFQVNPVGLRRTQQQLGQGMEQQDDVIQGAQLPQGELWDFSMRPGKSHVENVGKCLFFHWNIN